MEIQGKKIFVTGGRGFLGKHLIPQFQKAGAEVLAPSHAQLDLTRGDALDRAFAEFQPDIVIHAAGFLGGVHFSRLYPADVLIQNLQMVCNVLAMAVKHKIKKLVNIGSACVYSDQLPGPFQEKDILSQPMHESVQYYGFSKLALLLGGKALQAQHQVPSIHLVLANLYGPGDKFDPELSHVVSSMIPKFYEAARYQKPEVVCWGTGQTVREFLYVEDCAEAVVKATQLYEEGEPLNIGEGKGITMKELAETIKEAVGFKGRIVWDTSIPDGARYKVVDISRMRRFLRWEPQTPFSEGLKKTVQWFEQHYSEWLEKRK